MLYKSLPEIQLFIYFFPILYAFCFTSSLWRRHTVGLCLILRVFLDITKEKVTFHLELFKSLYRLYSSKHPGETNIRVIKLISEGNLICSPGN